MSTEPSAEDKARYESIRKELIQALPKKRAVDKQLVRAASYVLALYILSLA